MYKKYCKSWENLYVPVLNSWKHLNTSAENQSWSSSEQNKPCPYRNLFVQESITDTVKPKPKPGLDPPKICEALAI